MTFLEPVADLIEYPFIDFIDSKLAQLGQRRACCHRALRIIESAKGLLFERVDLHCFACHHAQVVFQVSYLMVILRLRYLTNCNEGQFPRLSIS